MIFTKTAIDAIKKVKPPEAGPLLRISVSDLEEDKQKFNLEFVDEFTAMDEVLEIEGLRVILDRDSLTFLSEMTIDYHDGSLVIKRAA